MSTLVCDPETEYKLKRIFEFSLQPDYRTHFAVYFDTWVLLTLKKKLTKRHAASKKNSILSKRRTLPKS